MEVLLHGGTQLGGWRTAQIHEAVRAAFGLSAEAYTLTQLRYDLRKLKAHGLLQREGRTYCYRLTGKGTKVSTLVYSVPPAHLRPSGKHAVSTSATANPTTKPPVKIEAAYHKADAAIQKLIDLLAA